MRSKRQSIVTLSPTETEHVALSNAKTRCDMATNFAQRYDIRPRKINDDV